MIAKFDLNKDLILRKSQEFFKNSSSLIPKIGCELEFFLFKKGGNLEIPDDSVINDFICKIAELVKSRFSLIYLIEKEQGASQIEAKFKFTDDESYDNYDYSNTASAVETGNYKGYKFIKFPWGYYKITDVPFFCTSEATRNSSKTPISNNMYCLIYGPFMYHNIFLCYLIIFF